MLWPWLVFVGIIGACVGSFLNVVVYRLPAGQSLIRPASHCPRCSHKLAWYDNVPVLGWLWLRGRCRYCQVPISVQYPIIEAITALLFGGWFYIAYMTDLRPELAWPGPGETSLVLVVTLVLIASLLAATLIDARLYIIPLEIPWTVTAAALVLLPLSAAVMPASVMNVRVPALVENGLVLGRTERLERVEPLALGGVAEVQIAASAGHFEASTLRVSGAPLVSTAASAAAMGGIAGLAVALVLLWRRILPRSFEEDVAPPGVGPPPELEANHAAKPHAAEDLAQGPMHPHPRREVLKECGFVAFPLAGAAIGAQMIGDMTQWPVALNVLGGVLAGYLVGGGIVWAIRILGTLGFGKEAMGLGDVHLMAAVGAATGWEVALLAFFVAPFFGLAWALLSVGAAKMLKREVKAIPYGPHLAAATLVVMVLRHPMVAYFGVQLAGG